MKLGEFALWAIMSMLFIVNLTLAGISGILSADGAQQTAHLSSIARSLEKIAAAQETMATPAEEGE